MGRRSVVYEITLPEVPEGTQAFNFTTTLPNGVYQFQFTYDYGTSFVIPRVLPLWRVQWSNPSGEVLFAQVSPNNLCCPENQFESLAFVTSLATIGLDDLSGVSMYLSLWVQ